MSDLCGCSVPLSAYRRDGPLSTMHSLLMSLASRSASRHHPSPAMLAHVLALTALASSSFAFTVTVRRARSDQLTLRALPAQSATASRRPASPPNQPSSRLPIASAPSASAPARSHLAPPVASSSARRPTPRSKAPRSGSRRPTTSAARCKGPRRRHAPSSTATRATPAWAWRPATATRSGLASISSRSRYVLASASSSDTGQIGGKQVPAYTPVNLTPAPARRHRRADRL